MEPRRHSSDVQHSPPLLHRTSQRDDNDLPGHFYSSPVRGELFLDKQMSQRRRRPECDRRGSPSPVTRRRRRDTQEYDPWRASYFPERQHSWFTHGGSSITKRYERSPESVRSFSRPCGGSLNSDGPMRIQNLSWVNPNAIKSKGAAGKPRDKPALLNPVPTPEDAPPSEQERADFNGLKGVPKGPRLSAASIPDVSTAFKIRPHVLVQADSLPADLDMTRHLEGFLRRFSPMNIHLGDQGYYVVFPDTPRGHRSLDACVAAKDRSLLFSKYVLRLESFHHGLATLEAPSITLNENMQAPAQTSDPRLQSKTKAPPNVIIDPAKSSPDLRSSFTTSVLPTERWRHSSPLHAPSRQSFDDASSLSGKTTVSDASSASKLKCHVCKLAQTAEIDALTRCSTCPRRYHQRCHATPAIPTTTEQQKTWQCRRCLAKQVPKRKIPVSISQTAANVTERVDAHADSENRPTKRARLEGATSDAQTAELDVIMQAEQDFVLSNTADETSGKQTSSTAASGDITKQDAQQAQKQVTTSMAINENQHEQGALDGAVDAMPMDEADLLVEESFALSAPSTGGLQKKGSKLNLVRKKLMRPSQEAQANVADVGHTSGVHGGIGSSMVSQPTASAKAVSTSHGNSESGDARTMEAPSITATTTATPSVWPEVPESPTAVRNTSTKQYQPTPEPQNRMPLASDKQDMAAQKPNPPNRSASASPSLGVAQTGRKPPVVDPSLPTAKRTKQDKTILSCGICKKHTFGLKTAGRALCASCKAKRAALQAHKSSDDVMVDANLADGRPGMSMKAALSEKPSTSISCADEQPAAALTSFPKLIEGFAKRASVQTELSTPANDNAGDVLDFWKPNGNADTAEVPDHATEPTSDAAQARFEPNATVSATNSRSEATTHSQSTALHKSASQPASISPSPPLNNTTEDADMTSHFDDTCTPKKKLRRARGRQSDRPYTWDEYIRFAMIDSPGYRLQAKGICEWLLKNIPEWCTNDALDSRISMTLSAHDANKGKRLWNRKKRQDSDRGAIGKGDWYVLERHLVESQPRWDPVLKRAVSPFAQTGEEESSEEDEDSNEEDEDEPSIMPRKADRLATAERARPEARSTRSSLDTTNLAAQATASKAPAGHAAKSARPSAPRRDGSDVRAEHLQRPSRASRLATRVEPLEDTSEDEPLAVRHNTRLKTSAPLAPMYTPAADAEVDEDHVMMDAGLLDLPCAATKASDQSETASVAHAAATRKPHLPTPESLRLKTTDKDSTSLAERIHADADNIDYSAKSLFEEWPQYDPKNEIDRVAKLQEIKNRPTRKQMFVRSTLYSRLGSWTDPFPISAPVAGSSLLANTSFEQRSNRSPQKQGYAGLPALEATVREVATIEELFDAPANPIPVLVKDRLCFRDGTLDRNGNLPRALVYYPTGFD